MKKTLNQSSELELMDAADFVNNSYFDYTMYTIMERAIPCLTDGLKPVHRRLLYSMHQLKLDPSAKFKKSARTVGDTLGKYHPHGDSACYEAMVLMAQPFSTLHPLVDGQGNWGSLDEPKSFAAMRYTEAKLTKYAQLLLDELPLSTVEFTQNFDGSLQEPVMLPAQMPNILINGTSGIAVGMASDIPPHNLDETITHCINYLTTPNMLPEALLETVQGPDLPTGGVIVSPRKQLLDAYRNGKGSVTLRADYRVEGAEIIIESLPFRTPLNRILEEIANQIETKALPQVIKIRDESDQSNPLRIVLVLRSNRVDAQEIMSHLFATTSLQSTLKFNFNVIDAHGKADTLSYYQLIRQWCQFRQEVFERKKRHRLLQIEKRIHILDGLLVAYAHLDRIIKIIREDDEPKISLMSQFSLSDLQAQAILDLRLKQLAKLEEGQLKEEHATLSKEAEAIRVLLASDRRIKTAVIKELEFVKKQHSQPRRTRMDEHALDAQKLSDKPQAGQPITVVLSEQMWIRQASGHSVDVSNLPQKTGDKAKYIVEMDSMTPLILLDTTGRFYAIDPSLLPQGKSTSEPLSKHLSLPLGAEIFWVGSYQPNINLLLCSRKGNAFITPMAPLNTKMRKGKEVWRFAEGDGPMLVENTDAKTHLAALSDDQYLGVIALEEINSSLKSQGIRTLSLPGELLLSDARLCTINESLTLTVSPKQSVKVNKLADFACARSRRGSKLPVKKK